MPRARGTGKKAPKATTPHCHTCGKSIRVPKGWGIGPAVRRHYWAKHPEVMQKKKGSET